MYEVREKIIQLKRKVNESTKDLVKTEKAIRK